MFIRICLKKNLYTRKRVKYYSCPKNDKDEFLNLRNKYVNENRKFVSIDETSFGRNYLPAFGRSIKGERIYIKRPLTRVTTCSVLSSVTLNEKPIYIKKFGSFNTQSFYDFLNGLKYPNGTVLLMDNVKFHHSKIIKELAKQKGWDILYTPAYSPIFNPIEGVFSIVKRLYQKCVSIEKSFENVTMNHIKSFFGYSFSALSRF